MRGVIGLGRNNFRDSVQTAVLERRYPYKIILPRHPDHPPEKETGDPRKSWLYDGVASGSWHAESGHWLSQDMFGKRIYRFANEADAVIFALRWR